MKITQRLCEHGQYMDDCLICNADYDREPYATLMKQEQRKLARIGGRPCEWSAKQWAAWSAKDED